MKKLLFLAVGILALCLLADAATIGIDFGSDWIKVGLVKPGKPIDIVLNEQSKRKTPNLVAFRNGDRFIGEPAANLLTRVPQQTFGNLKQLLGKPFEQGLVDLANKLRLPYKMDASDRGTVEFKVSAEDGDSYSLEDVLGMIFQYIQEISTAEADFPIKDAVISVPYYFTTAQREALVAGANIAGLKVTGLVPEHIAIAMQYGLTKRTYPEKLHNVLFFDLGAGSLKVYVMSFTNPEEKATNLGKIETRSMAVDVELGGNDFDLCLADHFAEEFTRQYPRASDIRKNVRSMTRLKKESQKVKEVLSANSDTPVVVESLHEDIDFRYALTRKQFEELCEPVFSRALAPVIAALEASEIPIEEIHSVELMGGGSRIPYMQKLLQTQLGRSDVNRSLNSDEAIALGAAFHSAILSPSFMVRKFEITDFSPLSISFALSNATNHEAPRTLFPPRAPLPAKKSITVSREDDLTVTLAYEQPNPDKTAPQKVAEYKISGVKDAIAGALVEHANADIDMKVKITFRLDESGIVHLEPPALNVEETIIEYPKENATAAAVNATEQATPEGVAEGEKAAPTATPVPAPTTSKKVHRKILKAQPVASISLTQTGVVASQKKLQALKDKDFEKERLAAAKNDLETFIYNTRDKAQSSSQFAAVTTQAERDQIIADVGAAEQWMEDEGYTAPLKEFVSRLNELRKSSEPAFFRLREMTDRPEAARSCSTKLNQTRTMLQGKWITIMPYANETERAGLLSLVEEVETWLSGKMAEQALASPTAPPAVTSSDIASECTRVERRQRLLSTKPAPRMPPKPKAKPPTAEKNSTTASNSTTADAPAGDAPAQEQPAPEQVPAQEEPGVEQAAEGQEQPQEQPPREDL